MAQLPSELITHSQKVCRLYKHALRSVKDWYPRINDFRYEAVLLRQRFEENRNIVDARVAKVLLLKGEEELFQSQHWQPMKFPDSVGGETYRRYVIPDDYILDYWHPYEKARYPKYFARREMLKKEYEELYKKWFPETTESEKNEHH